MNRPMLNCWVCDVSLLRSNKKSNLWPLFLAHSYNSNYPQGAFCLLGNLQALQSQGHYLLTHYDGGLFKLSFLMKSTQLNVIKTRWPLGNLNEI